MRGLYFSVLFATSVVAASAAYAQTPTTADLCKMAVPGSSAMADAGAAFERALSIVNNKRGDASRLLRRGADHRIECNAADSSGWSLLPVSVTARRNSAYARTVNDGAMWSGVGMNAGVSAGVEASWRFLSAGVQPMFAYAQNSTFEITHSTFLDRSQYANAYHPNIDFPERFGTDPLEIKDWGQSFVAATAKNLYARFSHENVWLGAAEVYPILMSSTAPGFTHFSLGTAKPINVWFADAEIHVLVGKLGESDYFDGNADNDDRMYSAALVSFQPRFLRGLYLGVGRVYHDSIDPGTKATRYVENLFSGPFVGTSGFAAGNSIGSVYARWVHPNSGFEAYVEWTREDAFRDVADFIREPDWTQGYVLGFQKVNVQPRQLTRFYGELVHLGGSAPERGGRGQTSYYTHGKLQQGHTHEGQLLGAAIGPGSDAQLLGVDVFRPGNWTRVRAERTRYDDDTYYNLFSRRFGGDRHDLELTAALSHGRVFGSLEVEAGLELSRRYDRDFMAVMKLEPEPVAETNIGTTAVIRWTPGWPR